MNISNKRVEDFNNKIEVTSNCHEWVGYKDSKGYGGFFVEGKMRRAHRVSYFLKNGELSSEMSVLHSCDNPSCVNPKHLRQGTHAENMKEMSLRKRQKKYTEKTHCKNGHLLSGDNIYEKQATRMCKTCARDRARSRSYGMQKSKQLSKNK